MNYLQLTHRFLIRMLLASQMAVGVLGMQAAGLTVTVLTVALDQQPIACEAGQQIPEIGRLSQLHTDEASSVRPRTSRVMSPAQLMLLAEISATYAEADLVQAESIAADAVAKQKTEALKRKTDKAAGFAAAAGIKCKA